MKKFQASIFGAAAFAFGAAALAIALTAHAGDEHAKAVAVMKRDFHAKGIAGTERLNEDGLQALCNRSHNDPPKPIAERLRQDQLEAIKYPADGKFLGDWKSGERIAQSGRGMTWNDGSDGANGGSCYNCHQIGPDETSFGNIGNSLRRFGNTRGNSPQMQKYVYEKIYNAKAFNLCSSMPRFGHSGTLTEQQIKDLVALLLDPDSPVNK
jgi:sulfur-oxidizing protein SoxX